MTRTNAGLDYVELHCHSNFSLLDGASFPEALVAQAAELGMPALALTDHDAVYGAVRFGEAAQAYGIRPIFGAELTLANGHHLTVLVENETGWGNLCYLIGRARHNAAKGQAILPPEALTDHTAGLIALSGCRQGEIAAALLQRDQVAAEAATRRYRDLFGPENFWIELQHHLRPDDEALVAGLMAMAQRLQLGYVATNNVHYATRAGRQLQDVLVCIRHHTTLNDAGPLLRPNSEFYLKSGQRMVPLFKDYPAALANTLTLAERCRFELRYGLQDLPQFPLPPSLTLGEYLRQLCEQTIEQRYPDPPERVYTQLDYELMVIGQTGLANYFLIVWDIVRFAREQGIRCQGRGSAANSLVAYLLHISPIDPLVHNLVFERFLSPERHIAPDIDLDFQADRREEVIQYVYERYGVEYAAMACTFVTYRTRSAVRDVAQALGLSEAVLAQDPDLLTGERDTAAATPDEANTSLSLLKDLCHQIKDFPRHLGIHNGGMVITGSPLAQRVPTEPATMPDRSVVQWDKESLETAGLIKIDLLGLRMLAVLAEAQHLVNQERGENLNLDKLTFDDPAVYEMIAQADTIGVFQVESRAQAQMLPRLNPRCFNDLIVAISLIRPGPIQGNMVHPYLRRRSGEEAVTYLHPRLEPALAETLGVILFQEQVLKVARDLAGLTPGQGEQLRRALGGKRAEAEMARLRESFLQGAQANGVTSDVAETVFAQLEAFGGYSFAKSHAAAFAVIVYQSASLKRYHPAAFLTSLLNQQPMGCWSPAVLLGDARRHGITVLPVDIQRSQAGCGLEGNDVRGGLKNVVRLGFNIVDGFGEVGITRLVETRRHGSFRNLAGLCRRTRLPRRLVEHLILAGALDRWNIPRRRLLWELGTLSYQEEELDLDVPAGDVELPELSRSEELTWEHRVLGLSTGDHVMTFYRDQLTESGILNSIALKQQPAGEQVKVAGLVVVHQAPPTAKGFHFLTLEDEVGLIDVIVRPQVVTQIKKLPNRQSYGLNDQTVLLVEGVVQQARDVVSILATRIQPLIPNANSGTSAKSSW